MQVLLLNIALRLKLLQEPLPRDYQVLWVRLQHLHPQDAEDQRLRPPKRQDPSPKLLRAQLQL